MRIYIIGKTWVPCLCSKSHSEVKGQFKGPSGNLLHTVTFLVQMVIHVLQIQICLKGLPKGNTKMVKLNDTFIQIHLHSVLVGNP